MGIDPFLDNSSLIDECTIGNSNAFEGGLGECLQEVYSGGHLGKFIATPYLELLDVREDGSRRSTGGLAFLYFDPDLLEQVRPRAKGPLLGYQGTRAECSVTAGGVWVNTMVRAVGLAEFVNHLVDKV